MDIENKKRDLLNLLSSNNYDIKDEETKQALLSIINENDSNISTKETVLCRILSLNEYNKYIKEGTAGESITKYDDSVWNYSKSNAKLCYWCGGTNYGQGWTTNFYPGGFTYSQATFIGDTSSGVATLTINNLFAEILASNTTNINTTQSNITIGLHVGARFNDICRWNHGQFSLIMANISKTQSIVSQTLNVYCNSGYSSGSRRGILTINVNTTFRPIFQYTDNKKSNDIFN